VTIEPKTETKEARWKVNHTLVIPFLQVMNYAHIDEDGLDDQSLRQAKTK
jgi:hypothetical protein